MAADEHQYEAGTSGRVAAIGIAGDATGDPPVDASRASPLDMPVEAVVFDAHPALLKTDAAHDLPTPYESPFDAAVANLRPAIARRLPRIVLALAWSLGSTIDGFYRALVSPPDFVVPKTFGMSAILGIMTALAFLDGCLYWVGAWPVLYLFFGVQSLVICLVQMFYGHTPRIASIVAGAVILPCFVLFAVMSERHVDAGFACLALANEPYFGALLGYLTGTCAAGIFLIMDQFERYLSGVGMGGGSGASAAP